MGGEDAQGQDEPPVSMETSAKQVRKRRHKGVLSRAWQQHTVKALSNMELRWRSLSSMYCFVAS